MNIDPLMPKIMHPALDWLGRVPGWCTITTAEKCLDDIVPTPRTRLHINWAKLNAAGIDKWPMLRDLMRDYYNGSDLYRIAQFEAVSRLIADGPKLFRPTAEQFEAMEHVALDIPPEDFRAPYPAIVVSIPNDCRNALAKRFHIPLDIMPTMVMIRERREPGQAPTVIIVIPFRGAEECFIFSAQPENPTIEVVINRRVRDNRVVPLSTEPDNVQNEQQCGTVIARAAMNLCLMLTHYGHKDGGPLNPADYQKHRQKKHLQHFKFGDFLTVNMKQTVVVRSRPTPTDNPPGPGSGVEMRPHWRRGHWRCYPGAAAIRAAGTPVPLLFVRPCLVRGDRASGDLSASETVYSG